MSTDSLSQFAIALQSLLDAARNYSSTQKTEDDLARVQSLFTGVQLAAPPHVTIPPFRRGIWPLESAEYVPVSLDGGRTYQPLPQYRTLQRGNWEECRLWLTELAGIAEAVYRQIALQAEATDDKDDPQAPPRGKSASAPKRKRSNKASKVPKKSRNRTPRTVTLLLVLLEDHTKANLNYTELASELGVHVSSVSRAFAHKKFGPVLRRRYHDLGARPPRRDQL